MGAREGALGARGGALGPQVGALGPGHRRARHSVDAQARKERRGASRGAWGAQACVAGERTHRRAGHDEGRVGRKGAVACGAATRKPGTATRLAGRPRHDHCACLGVPVCAWVCCWASRLCTWCTQPVFGLSTVFESLFGHCSSQKIFEKKNLDKIKSNQIK